MLIAVEQDSYERIIYEDAYSNAKDSINLRDEEEDYVKQESDSDRDDR